MSTNGSRSAASGEAPARRIRMVAGALFPHRRRVRYLAERAVAEPTGHAA